MIHMKNDNYSAYLQEHYNMYISDELGKILENLVIKTSIADKETNYDYFRQLQEYLKENNTLETVRAIILLKEEQVKEYLVCRWMIRCIDDSCSLNQYESFTDHMEEYCKKVYLNDSLIALLSNDIVGETKDEYKHFLKEYLNRMLETKKFLDYKNQEFVFLLIGIWKIIKSFFAEENPVQKENMNSFCKLLKIASVTNQEKKIASFKGLDLSYMDFSNENLDETCFYYVNFSHCNFKNASLDAISWSGSDISECDFSDAFLECAHLEDCNCRKAIFKRTHLLASVVSGADFSDASLENCNFMECDADRIKVKGLKIDNKTAFNDTDFRYVEWEDIDISGVSISDSQIHYFWELVNCTRNTILYDSKFKKLDNRQIQDVIYEGLMKSKDSYLKSAKLSVNVPDLFISYASEELNNVARPLYHMVAESEQVKKTVWLDENHLELGDKLRNTVESVIGYCKAALVIFSDSYKRKGWTKYEWNRVLEEHEKRKIPLIVLDMCTVEKLSKELETLCKEENLYYIKYDADYRSNILACLEKLV